jgi:hypothetical protein
MAEDLLPQMDQGGLISVLQARISCSREMTFTLHLSLARPLAPFWFERLRVKMVSDDGAHVYDAPVTHWWGTEDTLAYGVLAFDGDRLRRSISEDEGRNLNTFTPFRTIHLLAGDFERSFPNQNSLARFRDRSAPTDLPNDPFSSL